MQNTNNNPSTEQNFTKYSTWLKTRHLSPNTIQLYLSILRQFPTITNTAIQEYFQRKLKEGEPATLFWKKYALNSYAKFKKLKINWQQIVRIPTIQKKFFNTIDENELEQLKQTKIEESNWTYERNSLIFR